MSSFETNENIGFYPSKLNFASKEEEIMTGAVVKMLKKIADMPTANLIRTQMDFYLNVEWIRKNKSRLPQNRYKNVVLIFLVTE